LLRTGLAVSLALLLAAPAVAAPKAKNASGMQTPAALLKRGIALYNDQKYSEALVDLESAFAGSNLPDVLFHIGLCQRRLGKYAEAQATLEKFVERSPNLPAEKKTAVQNELNEIRALMGGTSKPASAAASGSPGASEQPKAEAKSSAAESGEQITLAFEASVEGAVVSIDGKKVGTAPMVLRVAPGTHTVTAKAPGHLPFQQEVNLTAGLEKHAMYLELEPTEETAAAASKPKGNAPVAGLVVTGLGAALMGGSIALSVHAANQSREVETLYARGGRWDAYYDARQDDGERAEGWAVLLGIAGGLTLATGVIITLAQVASEPAPEGEVQQAQLFLTPLREGGVYGGLSFRW
jgi:PEGA domain/Tetratricopeptide repeat